MLARRSLPVTSATWSGHWGPDKRYYARRSDGVCFAIDGEVSVVDLAGTTPPSEHARPVDSLPGSGAYTLSVLAHNPVASCHVKPSIDGPSLVHPRLATARLIAYGVRRRR
jgi:hypothetical protein